MTGNRFEPAKPTSKMGALCSNSGQPDLKRSKGTKKRLFIVRHEILNTLGRGRIRRIVDVLWCFKFVPDLSEMRLQISSAYGLAEGRAITEQESLELVHYNEGDKASLIEVSSHVNGQVAEQCFFDARCFMPNL